MYSKSLTKGDCSRMSAGSGNQTSAPVQALNQKSNSLPLGHCAWRQIIYSQWSGQWNCNSVQNHFTKNFTLHLNVLANKVLAWKAFKLDIKIYVIWVQAFLGLLSDLCYIELGDIGECNGDQKHCFHWELYYGMKIGFKTNTIRL